MAAVAAADAAAASVAEAVVQMRMAVHLVVALDGMQAYGPGGAYDVPAALAGVHVLVFDGAAIDQSDLGVAVQYCMCAVPGV